MKRVPAGQFKQTCLKLLDEVEQTREPVVVTKRGRAIARVVPMPRSARSRDWGQSLRGTIRIAGDIVAPAADTEEWEVLRR